MTRRRAVGISGLILLLAMGAGLTYAGRVGAIGVAYKAKMSCSGVFVSGREPGEVLADLEVDDLALLRHVNVSIDRQAKAVTATLLGLSERRAIYRAGSGCTLVLDGRTPGPGGSAEDRAGPRSPPVEGSLGLGPPLEADVRLETVLARAFAEPSPLRQRRTRAVVVVHKGRLVAERYAPGLGPQTPLLGWSMTKSVMNALAGILVKEGRLAREAPVPIPEWQLAGDPRGRITLDHLLRMSSGLRFDEGMDRPLSDVTHMLLGTADAAGYATSRPLEAAPGTRWRYSSGTSNIIARVIRQALKDDREYLSFPRRALFDRIGMEGAVLETDAAGTFVGSSFMYATARDWARFGLLYIQDGLWEGRRILPEGWVEYTRSAAPADPARGYGAHFWLEVPDEYGGPGHLPPDAFHAAGHEGQFVTIVPSREAVIVRLGLTRHPEAWDHAAFVGDVLAALGAAGE